MNRLANLEMVLSAAQDAILSRDWLASERLSERVRTMVLEAALADDRDSLARYRDRLMAFRLAAGRGLQASSVEDQRFAMLLRFDAALASVAVRVRPSALKASNNAELRSATDRVLHFLADRTSGATTTEITNAAQLAQGTVSRLLTELKAQGLVVSRRVGKNVISRLTLRGRKRVGGRFVRVTRKHLIQSYSPVPVAWEDLINSTRRSVKVEVEPVEPVTEQPKPTAAHSSDERLRSRLDEQELMSAAA